MRRLALGWTLEQLSERSGVDVGTISALEVRDSKRSIKAPALAKALGISLEDLLDSPGQSPDANKIEYKQESRLLNYLSPAPSPPVKANSPIPLPLGGDSINARAALRCLRDLLAVETPGVRNSVVALMQDLASRAEDHQFSEHIIERIMGALGHPGNEDQQKSTNSQSLGGGL